MNSAGPGVEYAHQLVDKEYYADDANAQFIYNGVDWKRLIQLFPDDTLADDAGWELAHDDYQGDCEGFVPCHLYRDFVPAVEFLRQFPKSNYGSAAVAEANAELTGILGNVAELGVRDTIDGTYDPAPVASLLARYDSVALLLAPSLRARVHAVTGPLWTRLGKSRR